MKFWKLIKIILIFFLFFNIFWTKIYSNSIPFLPTEERINKKWIEDLTNSSVVYMAKVKDVKIKYKKGEVYGCPKQEKCPRDRLKTETYLEVIGQYKGKRVKNRMISENIGYKITPFYFDCECNKYHSARIGDTVLIWDSGSKIFSKQDDAEKIIKNYCKNCQKSDERERAMEKKEKWFVVEIEKYGKSYGVKYFFILFISFIVLKTVIAFYKRNKEIKR